MQNRDINLSASIIKYTDINYCYTVYCSINYMPTKGNELLDN